MAAPAAAQPPPLSVRINEAEVKTTMPLPRAIQLVTAIVWYHPKSCTTATASTKTIGDVGVDRFFLWIMLVFVPSILIAGGAGVTYAALSDDGGGRELISGAGGYCFVAIPALGFVYMAVPLAAWGHLGLFAPRTPVAAWEAFIKGSVIEEMGFLVVLASIGVMVLVFFKQAWPLLFAWNCLLGLLIASIVSFWLCLLRTYGDGLGERQGNNSCGETVIDGLAYLYCRLLYEFAVKFRAGVVADAGMQQQLDADVAVV